MHPYISNRIVPKSNNQVIVHKKNYNTRDIMDLMRKALPMSVEQTKALALKLKGSNLEDTLRNVFKFLKTINYKIDDNGTQIVPLPSKILTDNRTDCKGLAIITHGILTNLGISHFIRFAKYANSSNPKEFTHVYVIVPKDPKDGSKYYTVDAVNTDFNKEFGDLAPGYSVEDWPYLFEGSIGNIFSDAWNKVQDWYQGSSVDKALENAQDKVKAGLSQFQDYLKQFAAKAADRAERIWQTIKKVSPVTVIARNSFLLLTKENVFNLAGKLGYASASDEEAVANSWDPQEFADAKALWDKVKNLWTILGGNPAELKKQIDIGKVKRPILNLNSQISGNLDSLYIGQNIDTRYIGEPVTITSALATAAAIIAAIKPILDAIRPQKGSLPPGASGSETPPYVPGPGSDGSGSGSGSSNAPGWWQSINTETKVVGSLLLAGGIAYYFKKKRRRQR